MPGIIAPVDVIRAILAGRAPPIPGTGQPPAEIGDKCRVLEAWRRNTDGTYRYLADYASSKEIIGGKLDYQVAWERPLLMPFDACRIFVRVTDIVHTKATPLFEWLLHYRRVIG